MGRVWIAVALLGVVSVAVPGCGRKSYEERLSKRIEELEYDRRLKKNLMDPPTEKRFSELAIFLRPPKDLALAKTVQLPVPEGLFDLESSFNDKTESALHVLARVKMPKKPATKGAPPPPPPTPRGEFVGDVLGILANVFGSAEGLQTPKFVEEVKKGNGRSSNRFKRLVVTTPDKEVKIFTYKQDNTEVALVFVYSPSLRGALASKIDLSLGEFATGPKATRLYNGGAPEEEADSGPGVM